MLTKIYNYILSKHKFWMVVYLSELFLLEITFMIIIYSNYFCSTYTFSYVVI